MLEDNLTNSQPLRSAEREIWLKVPKKPVRGPRVNICRLKKHLCPRGRLWDVVERVNLEKKHTHNQNFKSESPCYQLNQAAIFVMHDHYFNPAHQFID